ncbi:uncharacterized protein cubi_03315 [Cryptosporidium ubiquitum]|uniref:U3 small nucleolar RNA-associated protein 6 N-terminal domain-containing protein n=1 Tax=Cryptosporidium ubiquitum TaxID=857276 RepID=A0A1J4MGJ2_9CRYT|nr:uncharacterized protein cubi_03315 [Cryptosporidium ubiquitum]OII72579.1 hypothetical protein cubi_03315 [Cryptosporidium ubiquitum]
MADKVQRVMEDMVPELLDLGKRKVFSGEEIREIIKRRRGFEYKIASRTPTLRDFLEYLSYEYELERIRNTRTRALKLRKRTIGDYSIIRLIHFIFKRALRKFPSDEKLWLQNVDFCLKSGSSKALQRCLISALKHNPRNGVFWLIMSDRELQNGNAKEARSAILLGLRVNKESLILWRGFSQLETNIAYRKYLDSFSSSKLALNKGFSAKNSTVMPLIPILNHGLKRIKLEYKKEAHILFMFRQYHKLYNVLLEDGNLSGIEGMKELESQIIDSFNQSKKSQPLFPLFAIITAICKNDGSDIFNHFESEINQLFCNLDSEFVLVTLIFICRLIYNCTNGQLFEHNQGNTSGALLESANTSNIVDFGFQISESFQDFDNPPELPTDSDHPMDNCLNLDMITWYNQTCLENLLSRDNLKIKKAIHLLKLDPNFWNCCFLEDSTTEDLIKKLSFYSVPGIEDREIWKEKLFSKEQIESIRERIFSYLSYDSNRDMFIQLIANVKKKAEKLTLGPESQGLKLSLFEALDSLFELKQSNNDQYCVGETNFTGDLINKNLLQINDNIPQIIQAYKQFIIYYGTKPLLSDQITFLVQSVNKLLDLIEIQVENGKKQSENLDFIGFSKTIFWTLYMISTNLQESDEEHSQDLIKLRQRIILCSLKILPIWLSTKKIPGLLFNTLIIYSILNSIEKADNTLSSLVLKYLKSQETGMEVRFDSSPIIKILKESINDDYLIHTIEVLLGLLSENNWLLSNSITMISKRNKDITSITFMLTCISLLYLLFERYLKNFISQENQHNKLNDPNLQNGSKYLVSKLFSMWNHLNTYISSLDDFSSEEFKMNIHIRYLLLIKLIEHLKIKRILSPKFGEFTDGIKIPTFAELVRQFNKNSTYMRFGKLPSGLNIVTIFTLPVDDSQFELCLEKASILQEYDQETSEMLESQTNSIQTLNKVMQNILNPCQLLAPTSVYVSTNYL